MSVYIVLKGGVVLEYNDCGFVLDGNNCFTLRKTEQSDSFIAIIPREVVERVEGTRPCATYRTPRKDKLKVLK